jgi:diguanylate cyclase (GGDEF)-like protein
VAARRTADPSRWDDDATIVQSIALLVLLSLVLLAAVALWSSWRANDLAVAREARLAANAMDHFAATEVARLGDIAGNDDLYRRAHLQPTPAAVDELLARVVGPPASEATAVLIAPDGSGVAWSAGRRLADVDTAAVLRDIAPFIAAARANVLPRSTPDAAETGANSADGTAAWRRVRGRPAWVAALPLRPDTVQLRRAGPPSIAVIVQPLAAGRLDDLAHAFVLPELSFTAASRGMLPSAGAAQWPLISGDEVLGVLTWTSAMPGQWMLRNLMPQTLTAAGFVVVFAWFVVRRFRRRVDEMRQNEAAAKRAALHDGLSGLPNRLLFTERLDAAIATTRAEPSRAFAVVYIDLDRFKDINDTLGHQAGDEVIRQTALRLAASVTANDTAARLAGDEFAMILADAGDRSALEARLGRIVAAIGEPVPFGERTIYPGGSLGACIAPHDGTDRVELQHRADLALYRAKAAGRGRWLVYSDDMDDGHRRRQALRQDLRSAIAENRLTMLYQPSFRADDLAVIGLEARVAWDHPTRGRIPAAEFIPIAEESGMIRDLGHWVLTRACRDARAFPDLDLSINVSPSELRHPNFAADLLAALAAEDFPPPRLQVDLTENALQGDADMAVAVIERLRAAGVKIALDEFGSGQSSFNYLSRFRFDLLKIDREIIGRVETSNEIATIIHATVDLARRLGLATAAEGIETFGQLRFVQALGCDVIQGHLFARPMPLNDVAAFIAKPQQERRLSVA